MARSAVAQTSNAQIFVRAGQGGCSNRLLEQVLERANSIWAEVLKRANSCGDEVLEQVCQQCVNVRSRTLKPGRTATGSVLL